MKTNTLLLLLLTTCVYFVSCKRHIIPESGSFNSSQKGKASYYADKFEGKPTASGETFSNSKLTAAHRTLSFGTKVKVTNLSNNKSVVVRVNDRGPFAPGRIIDLSKTAAKKIDMLAAGVANVLIEFNR